METAHPHHAIQAKNEFLLPPDCFSGSTLPSKLPKRLIGTYGGKKKTGKMPKEEVNQNNVCVCSRTPFYPEGLLPCGRPAPLRGCGERCDQESRGALGAFLLGHLLFRFIPRTDWASQVARVVKNPPVIVGDVRVAGSSPGSGRSPGGGHGNPLQCSCLENPLDEEPGGLQSTGPQGVGHD